MNEPYICMMCGTVYDPAIGDAARGIPPGTAFSSLPPEWCCPSCGADKELFEVQE